MIAIWHNRVEIIKYLLSLKDIDLTTRMLDPTTTTTPQTMNILHYVCRYANKINFDVEIFRLLFEHSSCSKELINSICNFNTFEQTPLDLLPPHQDPRINEIREYLKSIGAKRKNELGPQIRIRRYAL